tara:strand:- start:1438 stop:2016 length:579 start_codon:yes stop_codon:yes gene_type:complete
MFKESKKELENFARYVIQQSRSNLTRDRGNRKYPNRNNTKNLYNSLDFNIEEEKGALLVEFLMADYGEFVDEGVRGANPNKLPEGARWKGIQKAPTSIYRFGTGSGKKGGLTRAIEKWVKQKNIKGRDTKTGRFITQKSMQYLIRRSIFLSGIRATQFFSKPFNKGQMKFFDAFEKAFALDVEKGIILATEK